MNHYYLVASLPELTLDTDPPFSTDEFLFSTTGVLSEGERDTLAAVLGGESVTDSRFAGRWGDISTQLRNSLVKARAQRYNTDARPYMRSGGAYSMYIDKIVQDAMSHDSPIDRERALDRGRMELADELAAGLPFSFEVVLAFAVKLKIVERWARMSREEGRRVLDAFIDRQTGDGEDDGSESPHEIEVDAG